MGTGSRSSPRALRAAVKTIVAAAAAALLCAAPASAAITPSRDANAVAGSITEQLPLGSVVASFATIPPAPQCSNGIDDDDDGLIDFTGGQPDPGCEASSGGASDGREQEDAPAQCANGFDDDGDGAADFPADPGCSSAQDDAESDGVPDPEAQCANGFDDDGDGRIDATPPAGGAADPGCAAATDLDEGSEGVPPNAAAVANASPPLAGFPTSGPGYAILSTGNATFAGDPDVGQATGQSNEGLPGGHGDGVIDLVTLRIDLNVPVGASCLRFDVRFLSEEFPEYVGGNVNDAFLAELDRTSFQAAADGSVSAPDNFAFDTAGNLVSVNTAEFSAAEAAGTTYDGATPRLRASTPITPGGHTIFLSLFDQGDAVVDSAVFVDAMRFESASAEACRRGATADVTAPAVTLTSPAPGSAAGVSPVFAGAAGDAPGDSGTVALRVFPGGAAAGSPVQQLAVARSGAAWSVQGGPLAPGTYTAQAQQEDASGNVGSATSTFTVPAVTVPPPVPEPLPDPVTGKSFNVVPVRGIVTVRLPNGKTVRLEDAEQIPTGSVVDTRKGTVRLFSTGPGGKVQNAIFFDGLFKVTQTRGAKPLTTLKLVEKLARCPTAKRGAQTSAKRRKRRLWGDGKGSFRTSGRRSAATVSGTKWLVEDSCAGTLTRVVRGKVRVRDFKKRKTVTVKAGKRYLAR